jgi:hypothetical protein
MGRRERACVNGERRRAQHQQHQYHKSDARRPTHFPSDVAKARSHLFAKALWRKEEGRRKCLLAAGAKAV